MPPGIDRARHLTDMIFLTGNLLTLAIRVLLIRRRGQSQIANSAHVHIAFGVDLTGDSGDIPSGIDLKVLPYINV